MATQTLEELMGLGGGDYPNDFPLPPGSSLEPDMPSSRDGETTNTPDPNVDKGDHIVHTLEGENAGASDPQDNTPPSAPAPNTDTPAPGNDANQIQGWASEYLGRNFSQADIDALQGQPLSLVLHNIANSPEAMARAQANKEGPWKPQAQASTKAAAPSAPTPASTDYSQLNALLSALLTGSNARTQQNTDFRNNIKQTVMQLIKSGSAPVDPNDPTITSATSAFRGEGERALALLREKQAESSRSGGRTAGSEESAMKGGYEDLGNATGSYRANLQIQELNARRQQLMQAASLGAGVSNADESNDLQSQIAAIDAQIKELSLKTNANLTQQGITNQNRQFYDNLTNQMGNQTNTLDELLSQYLMNAA